MWLHRKVWLAWGSWWAVQVYWYPSISVGLHVDLRQPYLDLHLGMLTCSVGWNPVLTNPADRYRGSCRGFLFGDEPIL